MSHARFSVFALSLSALFGQTADRSVQFDVASVKLTSGVLPDGRIVAGMLPPVGGPGTNEPGRVHYPAITLKLLILKAYDVQDTALNAPDWLNEEFIELDALMPTDTTAEQFRLMLQHLLSERFKLVVHREEKAQSGYTLVVSKGGPKIKESAGDLPPRDENWKAKVGKDGFVVARPGQRLFVEDGRLRCRWTYQHAPMELLAGGLQVLLGKPVTDATGLTKNYDFSLTFRTAGTTKEAGPMAGVPWGASRWGGAGFGCVRSGQYP